MKFTVSRLKRIQKLVQSQHFKAKILKLIRFGIYAYPTSFDFWHSGNLALSPERQSARMSEIKNGRLGLYGAEDSNCDTGLQRVKTNFNPIESISLFMLV